MGLEVAIAGAGIGGLTAALCLQQQGCQVQIFEQATALDEAGTGIQISPNAMHVLNVLGVACALEQVAFEPLAGSLRHYQTGHAYLTSVMQEVYLKRYGAKYLHVHRTDLIKILHQAAIEAGVAIHMGASVAGYQQNDAGGVEFVLVDGTQHESALLVGADGIHSAVRRTMLGEENARFTGQVAWRALVSTSQLPAGSIPPDVNVWLGPARHFVAYYVRGGTLINFVAVENRSQWASESWNEKGNMNDVRAAFAGWDPRITQLLEACEECYLWGLFDRDPLTRWSDGCAVLLGDACHPMLPFMAQGGAMAIEDSYVLAATINAYTSKRGQSLHEAFSHYEERRKPRTTKVQAMSRTNARMFHLSGLSGRFIRALQFCLAKIAPGIVAARLDKLYGANVTEAVAVR